MACKNVVITSIFCQLSYYVIMVYRFDYATLKNVNYSLRLKIEWNSYLVEIENQMGSVWNQ